MTKKEEKTREGGAGETQKQKGWRSYKNLLSWMIFVIILGLFAFLRYGNENWLPSPEVYLSDFQDESYEMTPESFFVVPFSQRMNKESVSKAITILPELEYEEKWDGKTLYLIPPLYLQKGNEYQVFISHEAKSFFGKHLEGKVELHYRVGEEPRIEAIYPNREQIDGKDHIAVLFSHPMVSEKRVLERWQPTFLELTPAMSGEWRWYNSKTVVFHQKNALPDSTEITLISKEPLQTRDGGKILESIHTVFQTERLMLYPSKEEKNDLLVSQAFEISFSIPIEKSELKENIKVIERSGKETPVDLTSDQEGKKFFIAPKDERWLYDEEYTLQISAELMPRDGNLSLGEEKEMLFHTEPFLQIGAEYRKDETIYLHKETNSFTFSTKENIDLDILKNVIRFIPDEEAIIEKKDQNVSIRIPGFSQKRETIDFYITTSVNTKKRYLSEPIKYSLKRAPEISTKGFEDKRSICLLSNNKLDRTTYIVISSNENEVTKRMRIDVDSICPSEENFSYAYVLDKEFLEPGIEANATIHARDIFGETNTDELSLSTDNISREDILLQRKDHLFYQHASSKDELRFEYETKNLEKLSITTCKLSAEKVIEIETQYEKKWYSFEPTLEKCLRFRSVREEFAPNWGRIQNHVFDISEVLDDEDIETGLYYVSLSAPGYRNEQGEPIEENVMIQYSHWQLFSKRGKSTLAWLINAKEGTGVPNTDLYFISNDGLLRDVRETDKRGLYFSSENMQRYEFILAKNGTEELLLNAFSQEGFEPARFHIPFNADQSKYYYQFYIEDPNLNSKSLSGVFLLREEWEGKLIAPNISEAVVSLYDEFENIIWKSYRSFDDFGVLDFNIESQAFGKNGEYQLSVCVGLQQEICHGTHFWTFISKGKELGNEESNGLTMIEKNISANLSEDIIQAGDITELEVGDMLPLRFNHLESGTPFLLTAERDYIHFHDILTPRGEGDPVSIQITEEMVPEFVVTVIQASKNGVRADMKRFFVKKNGKELILLTSEFPEMTFSLSDGMEKENVSVISFLLNGTQNISENESLDAFYPNLGTSVITAGSVSSSQVEKLGAVSVIPALTEIPDLVVINGKLEPEGTHVQVQSDNEVRYVIAQDTTGHFLNKILNKKNLSKDVEIISAVPSFVRPGDKAVIQMSVFNNREINNNFSVQIVIPDVELINGEKVLLGIPALTKREIEIPIVIRDTQSNQIPVYLEVKSNNETMAVSRELIQIGRDEKPFSKRYNKIYQSYSQYGEINLPIKGEGKWNITTIISPSPIAYTMYNLEYLMSQKAMNQKEIMSHIGLYFLYRDLLETQGEENFQFSTKNIENELAYLEALQNSDGGWGKSPKSDPWTSAQMAKSLSSVLHRGGELSENMRTELQRYLKDELDERVNTRAREEVSLSEVSEHDTLEELYLLSGLSSLTASGISYTNNWYQERSRLSHEGLVLILLVLEDYRDQKVPGVEYKIEEIMQLLQEKTHHIENKKWLVVSSENSRSVNDFVVSSWYLEALVRQASSHSDVPEVINWLLEEKEKGENLSQAMQESFLTAMGIYLEVYSAEIEAAVLQYSFQEEHHEFEFISGKKHQAFKISKSIQYKEGDPFPQVSFGTDRRQALFIEVIGEQESNLPVAINRGISIHHFLDKQEVKKGDIISGEIIVFSSKQQQNLMVLHPQIGGAKLIQGDQKSNGLPTSFRTGYNQQWYLISKLEEGETRIPFQWKAEFAGVFEAPPVYAYLRDDLSVHATSSTMRIEIR